jgi:hypothetical protein
MSPRWLAVGVVVLSSVGAAPAAERTPEARPADVEVVVPARPAEGGADDLFPFASSRECSAWSMDFLFGLPTGFRAKRSFEEDEGGAWQMEGFAGLEVIFPMVGGGVRRRFTPFSGKHDAVCVSPGVDAYLLVNPFAASDFFHSGDAAALVLTGDVDVSWRHTFRWGWEGELGLKLGAGAGLGARWGVLPVAGVFAGSRF